MADAKLGHRGIHSNGARALGMVGKLMKNSVTCKLIQSISIIVLGAWSSSVQAVPNPSNVQLSGEGDRDVIIFGTSFGDDGPEIVLFDDFEGQDLNNPISGSSPRIGKWTLPAGGNPIPIAYGLGRSGSRSILTYDGSRQRQMQLQLNELHSDIFISYWVRLAPGSYFPGTEWSGGRQMNKFSTDSSWKFTWLINTADGFGGGDGLYDICLPTWTGSGGFQVAGNSTPPASDRYVESSWWDWSGWMRVSIAISDPTRVTGDRYMTTQLVSQRGHVVRKHSAIASSELPLELHVFDTVNFPGWIRTNSGNDVMPLYDDIYVAVGGGAKARVELANTQSYADATQIELLLVDGWSDSEIRASIPPAVAIDGESTWYLFVTDAAGQRNSAGWKFEACEGCPLPPGQISVD